MNEADTLHIAIPSHRREPLTHCAVDAVRRTLQTPYRLWIVENDDPLLGGEVLNPLQGSYANGRKLDAVLVALPHDAEWFFVMHSDSAPLAPGWYAWLRDRMGHAVAGGFLGLGDRALPHPCGALYRVAWLRDTRASFLPRPGFDVGAGLCEPPRGDTFIAPSARTRPWWLRRADVAADTADKILYGHLGGGTIGATSWRIPWRTWPGLVRRYLHEAGAPA